MKISIITVTYNSASTLQSTIDSIQTQTIRKDIEYIIVDGESKDGTIELIRNNKNAIDKWISEPDNGIYDAMNKGLKMATGDWVGYLHADDVLAGNNIIEQIIQAITQKDINTLYGNLNYVQATNINKTVRHWKSQAFKPSLLNNGWMPPHPTLYVNRKLFLNLGGFDTRYSIAADYDFILRLFSHPGTKSYFLDQLIIKMRMGGASNRSLSNIIKKSKEDYLALKRNNIGGIWSLFIKNISKLSQFFRQG